MTRLQRSPAQIVGGLGGPAERLREFGGARLRGVWLRLGVVALVAVAVAGLAYTPATARASAAGAGTRAAGVGVGLPVLRSPGPLPGGTHTSPAPTPSQTPPAGKSQKFDWCDLPGVNSVCDIKKLWDGGSSAADFATHPFEYIAKNLLDAIGALLTKFADLMNATSTIDLTNSAFLRTYTMMFGLATFFTMILWVIAVGKRAVAGVPVLEAAAESVAHLLMAVVATAFAPAAVYLVNEVFDLASAAMFAPVAADMKTVVVELAKAYLLMLTMGGGGVFMSFLGTFLLFAVVSVWVELVVRSAMLYLALAFGPLTFAGLVDRSLWKHTKRWVGLTLGIIMSKLVTLTVLALATGMLATIGDVGNDVNKPVKAMQVVFTALALFFLAFMVPGVIARFVPAFGDDLASIAATRREATEQVREGGAPAKSAAEEMAGTTKGRAQEVKEGLQQDAADRQAAKKPAGTGSGAGKAAEGGEAAEAAAGPVGAAAAALEKIKEVGEKAVDSGVERATGGDGGQGGGGGGPEGGPMIPPPEVAPPAPPGGMPGGMAGEGMPGGIPGGGGGAGGGLPLQGGGADVPLPPEPAEPEDFGG